ncbi:uncharacterized protein LOC134395903 [Elgaria multicarinata webbii]|uniref:uncharacterized protein LOC134395903 n=1 Tax=Elgaria multicarinata webbii TaxID=159646 RepID=UPI002FCCCA03
MARTLKASQKLVRASKPWKKAVPQGTRRRVPGHDAGQETSFRHGHPRMSALQLIHRYQKKASGMMLDKLPFLRFTKKLAHGFEWNLRFQTPAVLALKEASQAYLLELFEDWHLCALHAKRFTVSKSDVHLARCLRQEMTI